MNISTTGRDEYRLGATITLDAHEVTAYAERARHELARNAAVPGFRTGKAPANIAEKGISPDTIREAALELALAESFEKAVAQEGWDVSSTEGLKVTRNEPAGLSYEVTVHLWPSVVLGDFANIRVPRRAVQVREEEIDESLDTVRATRASLLDKTGAAQDGDRVEIDIDASIGGIPVSGGSARNHALIIGGKTFLEGFEEQLVGLSSGMAKSFALTAPEGYPDQQLAGKTIEFAVTMKRVQAVLKPAADDAFAKTLGDFGSLGELRNSIRDHLIREQQVKERQRLQLAILDGIIGASTVPAPAVMVTEELDGMITRFADDLAQRNLELPLYLARIGKTQEQLRDDWKSEAERQVRIRLILRAVTKRESISVAPDELNALAANIIQAMTRAGQPPEQLDPDRLQQTLAQRLLRDKALDFLERTCATEA